MYGAPLILNDRAVCVTCRYTYILPVPAPASHRSGASTAPRQTEQVAIIDTAILPPDVISLNYAGYEAR